MRAFRAKMSRSGLIASRGIFALTPEINVPAYCNINVLCNIIAFTKQVEVSPAVQLSPGSIPMKTLIRGLLMGIFQHAVGHIVAVFIIALALAIIANVPQRKATLVPVNECYPPPVRLAIGPRIIRSRAYSLDLILEALAE